MVKRGILSVIIILSFIISLYLINAQTYDAGGGYDYELNGYFLQKLL